MIWKSLGSFHIQKGCCVQECWEHGGSKMIIGWINREIFLKGQYSLGWILIWGSHQPLLLQIQFFRVLLLCQLPSLREHRNRDSYATELPSSLSSPHSPPEAFSELQRRMSGNDSQQWKFLEISGGKFSQWDDGLTGRGCPESCAVSVFGETWHWARWCHQQPSLVGSAAAGRLE